MAPEQTLEQLRKMNQEEDACNDGKKEFQVSANEEPNQEIELDSLNDKQLRELLDEAIQYKNPKDRLGKSQMFQELLEQAEADESDSQSSCGLRGRKISLRVRPSEASARTSTGGSLQNISSTSDFDSHHSTGVRRKQRTGRGVDTSVSARQREGGSLPSNVNTDNYFRAADSTEVASWRTSHKYRTSKTPTISVDGDESGLKNEAASRSSNFGVQSGAGISTQARRQTLKHSSSNELPMADKPCRDTLRRHNSSCDEVDGRRINDIVRPQKTSAGGFPLSGGMIDGPLPQCYRVFSRDDLEANSEGARELYTTSASLEVESVDSHMQIPLIEDRNNVVETMQLDGEYPAVQSIINDSSRLIDCSSRSAESFRHCGKVAINPRSTLFEGNRYTSFESENATRPASIKKTKIKRGERNVVVTSSENTPGYQGRNDIQYLLKFIESDKEKEKNKALKKPLQQNKKASSSLHEKKQKSLQKSSSLEEISQRNIEDLTVTSTTEGDRSSSTIWKIRVEEQRRSWGDQEYIRSGSQNDLASRSESINQSVIEVGGDDESDSEFQMVTKKQRKRRAAETNAKRTRNRRNGGSRRSPRRKSASSVPPSERSGDSDVESVHSLPASGSRVRPGSDSDCDNLNGGHGDVTTSTPSSNFLDTVNLTGDDFPSLPIRPGMKASPQQPTAGNTQPRTDWRPPATVAAAVTVVAIKPDLLKAAPTRCSLHKPANAVVLKPPVMPAAPQSRPLQTEMPLPPPSSLGSKSLNSKPQKVDATASKFRSKGGGPPVILLDECRARDSAAVCEITFGFEVNQQLLLTENCEGGDFADETSDVIVSNKVVERTVPIEDGEVSVADPKEVTDLCDVTNNVKDMVLCDNIQVDVKAKVKTEDLETDAAFPKFLPPVAQDVTIPDYSRIISYLTSSYDNIVASGNYVYYESK